MQQDSKLEGWEVVSHKKEKKKSFISTLWSILWKPEKSSNTVNPVTVSTNLLSKESQANIFKQQLCFMKRKEGGVRGTIKSPKAWWWQTNQKTV